MKTVFFATLITLLAGSCNQAVKKEDTSTTKNGEVKALYEKKLTTLKAFIADFEKEDSNGMAALVADTAQWLSPAYGDIVHSKKHMLESLQYYLNNWSNIHLTNGQFLPGIDSASHEFDGSVRYYGRWDGLHSSGKTTQVNFYGTYEFNKDNKIISGADYYDVGGLLNAIKPMSK